MPATASPIAVDSWMRRVRIPLGKDVGTVDLDSEVEITIRGKVKELHAAEAKGEHYKSDPGRPAEISIEIKSVTFNNKTNTFTKMARDLDKYESDYD